MKKLLLFVLLPLSCFGVTISPSSGALATGTLGTAYSATLAATGVGPFTWTVTAGQSTLNAWGLSRSAPTGISINIAGTPFCPTQGNVPTGANPPSYCQTAVEPMFNSSFTVTVTDAGNNNVQASANYTIALYWNPTMAMFMSTSAYRQGNLLSLAKKLSVSTPPALGGLLIFSNPVFMTSGSTNLPTWKHYVNVLAKSHATVVSIYPDLGSYVTDAPGASANRQLYTDIANYARTQYGMHVHVRPEYHAPSTIGGGAISITSSPGGCTVTTVMTYDACVNTTTRAWLGGVSAYQYMAATLLKTGDQFDPVHEPTTIASFWGQLDGVTDNVASGTNSWAQFMTDSVTQITAGCPTCGIGVALFLSELTGGALGGDLSYDGAVQTNVGGTWQSHLVATSGLTAWGVDIYALGVNNMVQFGTAFQIAKNNGKTPYIAEFGLERWVPNGLSTTEQNAIQGCMSSTWEETRHRENHMFAFWIYLASQGVVTATLFPSESLIATNTAWPDSCWPGSLAITNGAFLAAVNAEQRSPLSFYTNQLLANWAQAATVR